MYGYIYKVINLINFWVYIGQHKGIFNPKYFGGGILINRAIKKHGLENFTVKQIASAEDRKELDVLEIFYIKKYRETHKVYNIADGGLGWHITHPTKERCRNQSISRKKYYEDPENRLKRVIAQKKVMQNLELRQQISNKLKGHKTSEETRRKLSQCKIGHKTSQETIEKIRRSNLEKRKGLTKQTNAGIAAQANKMTGRTASIITKNKMSASGKRAWKRRKQEVEACP